jgi:XTP/dITP diphosphohydrolase
MPPARKVVVATSNPGKVIEIKALLGDLSVDVCSLAALPPVDFPEEDGDYTENALGKARAVAKQLGELAVGDDSGLEVAALGGRPGVHSARYGGPGLDDGGRLARLLAEMADANSPDRSARFVCVAAAAAPDGRSVTARGECVGRILSQPTGSGGFGYDPVFVAEGQTRSMAELDSVAKDAISHRGHAFRSLKAAFMEMLESR